MERRVINELKKLYPLVEEKEEYGGIIDCYTLAYSYLIKGKEHEIDWPLTLPEGREVVNRGGRFFHSHPRRDEPGPSGTDIYIAAICGSPAYILTADGLYGLIPEITMDLKECRMKDRQLEIELENIDDEDGYQDIYAEEAAKVFRVKIKLYKM